MKLFIDEEEIYRVDNDDSDRSIWVQYDFPGFLMGWHTIKVEAADSFNNKAIEDVRCFIINFV
jgi:hypothetical protein